MQKELLWNLFSKTGDINAYLLLKEYEELTSNNLKTEHIEEDVQNVALR